MHGLAAVLDHVQTRISENEMYERQDTECQSLTSTDTDDEADTLTISVTSSAAGQEEKNRQWLKKHHLELIDAIDPNNSLLVHKLVQDHVLTISDEDEVLSCSTRKNRAREMVMKLRRCTSSQFVSFQDVLRSEYPHLTCLCSVDDDTGESDEIQHCVMCDVMKVVSANDVIDNLYHKDAITANDLETVLKINSSREKWRYLWTRLRTVNAKQNLVDALQMKYPEISKRLFDNGNTPLGFCCCSSLTS